MEIGQRINLIKKIAAGLGEQGFRAGDLVLRQFGLPWTDSWNGSGGPSDYFLEMVENGDAKKLAALHEYLFPGDPLPSLGTPPTGGRWSKGTLRLFLSHSSSKKSLVTQLKQELARFGVESFVAHADIEPSRQWLNEIRFALDSCQAFAAMLCQDFKESKYCDQEVGYALHRGLLIIPIRLEIDPYGFMAPLQGVPAFGKQASEIAPEVMNTLLSHPTTKPLMESAREASIERLVDDFLCSNDFATSSKLLRNLEGYDELPKRLVDKISVNWERNDQISGCAKIPERMAALLKHHARVEFSKRIKN